MEILVERDNVKAQNYLKRVVLDAHASEGRPCPSEILFLDFGQFLKAAIDSSFGRVNRRIQYRIRRNGWKYGLYQRRLVKMPTSIYEVGEFEIIPLPRPNRVSVGKQLTDTSICHWSISNGFKTVYNQDVDGREECPYPDGHFLLSEDGNVLMNSNGIAGNPVYYFVAQ